MGRWRGLGISWREVLGLLIGLAVCYGVISYALTSAQDRETASKQTQENTQQEATSQRTTSAVSDETTKTLTLRVGGLTGQSFGANFGNLYSSRSVEGRAPTDYEVQVTTDPGARDYVTATVWKTTGDSNELRVQLLDNGSVIKESSTTRDYGVASVRWSPGEPQSGETTTPRKKAPEYSVLKP
jgi:hypothetical protein